MTAPVLSNDRVECDAIGPAGAIALAEVHARTLHRLGQRLKAIAAQMHADGERAWREEPALILQILTR